MTPPDAPGADILVQTALRHLPVPEHGPDFWDRLTVSLESVADGPGRASGGAPTRAPADRPSSEPPAAAGAGPWTRTAAVPVVELAPSPVPGVVPPAMRRPSNLVLSGLAVAAAVAVVVAATSLVRARTDDGDRTRPAATGEAGDPAPGTGPAGLVAPADEPAAGVVVDWIDALAAGDMEAAWALLGPRTQAAWGSFEAFAAARTELAEGYAAWRVAGPQVLVTPVSEAGDGALVVVLLAGLVPQEGTTGWRADAFPVRLVGERGVLELPDRAGSLEIVVPEPTDGDGPLPVLAPGDEIVVVVPAGVEPPILRLGEGPVLVCGEAPGTELTELAGSTGQRCGYAPPGGLPPGDHALLAAFTSPDGRSVTAHGAAFRVG